MKLEVASASCLQVVLLYICVNSLLLVTVVFLESELADMKCVELLHLRLQYSSFKLSDCDSMNVMML